MPSKKGSGSRSSSIDSTNGPRSCTSSQNSGCSQRRKRISSCDTDDNGNKCYCGGNRQRDRFQHPEIWSKGCVGNKFALEARLAAYKAQQEISNGTGSCCPPPVPLLCHIRCIARQKGMCGHKDGCCPCCCPTVRCPCNDCCISEEPRAVEIKNRGTDPEPQVSVVQQPQPAWNSQERQESTLAMHNPAMVSNQQLAGPLSVQSKTQPESVASRSRHDSGSIKGHSKTQPESVASRSRHDSGSIKAHSSTSVKSGNKSESGKQVVTKEGNENKSMATSRIDVTNTSTGGGSSNHSHTKGPSKRRKK